MVAVHETAIRQSSPLMISNTPAATEALALALSFGIKLVHFPLKNAMKIPAMPVTMETTTRARAACRSPLRASMESYTLHCSWPVLWDTQVIQMPSHTTWDVTMLLPMKAVTRHMGVPQTMSTPIQPSRPMTQPAICNPMEAIAFPLRSYNDEGAAEEGATQDEEPGCAPADVERGSQLPPLGVGQEGVVEIPDDGVGGPADGDEDEHAGANEDNSSGDGHFGLGVLVVHEVGALASDNAQDDPEGRDDDGDDHKGPGRLEVLGQRQQGIVDLALHLARALRHAVHPQALPDDLRRHNVGSDEGCDLPHGQGAHNDGPQEANDAQGKAQHLSSH
ncbi:hypothetical protein EYF80_033212 [Liparis tanakae]|uniref:Uncharacterized protein n=1 Tax=Liparis tanakae TaxID=230148 RepID=A0A4Z2GSJ8_9TELE|nr:hypothetical protein EYF80_033212 [Liparis tanakae]